MVRRALAVALLVALVLLSFEVGGLVVGGDDSGAAGDESATTVPGTATPGVTDGTSPATSPDGSTAAAPTAAPTTAPTTEAGPPAVPSTADPALVLIAGDSDAGTFGPYLETLVGQTGVATTQLDYKVSSGLARPDFFDWPAHFTATIPTVAPDIIVVTFGGNDAQGLADINGNFIVSEPTGEGDDEWRAEYGRRVGEVMDFLSASGRTLIWVGIPNDDNPEVTARMQVQDEVVRGEVAKRPHVVFIDTWKRFSGREGNWAEYVIDPRDGQGKDVRADDGFHLNEVGAEILALDIAEAIRVELRNRGASF